MWLLAVNYLSYAQARANLVPLKSLEASGVTVTPACAGRYFIMSELDYMDAIAGAENAEDMAANTIAEQWKQTTLRATEIVKAAATSPSAQRISGGEGEGKYTGADLVRALASRLVRRLLVRHGVLSPATAPIRPAVEPS